MNLAHARIALIVTGGISAYKALDLARLLIADGAQVQGVLTRSGARFVTPLALGALTGLAPRQDLFDLDAEATMSHIALARDHDLICVVPASADFIARMAQGRADDLATAMLLATDRAPLIAPAMNPTMWRHPATQANLATLAERGVSIVPPDEGMVACGEHGIGRLASLETLRHAIHARLSRAGDAPAPPLRGIRALVTAGPTHEALDPVRYLANKSSGKQGYAIAQALAEDGAHVALVSGPTALADPPGVDVIRVESARAMLAACQAALPCHVAVCAAAVADFRPQHPRNSKIPKADLLALTLTPNPDILARIAQGAPRPQLVLGFAAQTGDPRPLARAKLAAKGCDWIVANDIAPETGVMGGDANTIHLLNAKGEEESWPRMTKHEVARRLSARISQALLPTNA